MRKLIAAIIGCASCIGCCLVSVELMIHSEVIVCEYNKVILTAEIILPFIGAIFNGQIIWRWLNDIGRNSRK